jgi:hypothetical protein
LNLCYILLELEISEIFGNVIVKIVGGDVTEITPP